MQTSRYASTLTKPISATLEGLKNFRDLGGFPSRFGKTVRKGQLFRSESHSAMTFRDAEYLAETLAVTTVIDLRSTAELHEHGPSLLVWRDVPMFHIPILDTAPQPTVSNDPRLIGGYLAMLDEAGARFAAVAEIVAEATGPVAFHGAAGRDRTGLVAAVLLSVLGVADRGIGADFGLTVQQPSLRPTTVTTVMALLRAEHGSVEQWLVNNGLDEAACPAIRERLLG